jgi:hypothetical protein
VRDLLSFLRERVWLWLVPILALVALAIWTGWQLARTPDAPFTYDL